MALQYSRLTLFSINSVCSSLMRRPLNPAVWRNLLRSGIARAKPTRRGCRAGKKKIRAITTVVTKYRQDSSWVGNHCVLLDKNTSMERDDLHILRGYSLNIHLDALRNSNSIVVERTPLLPKQRKHSPELSLCSAKAEVQLEFCD